MGLQQKAWKTVPLFWGWDTAGTFTPIQRANRPQIQIGFGRRSGGMTKAEFQGWVFVSCRYFWWPSPWLTKNPQPARPGDIEGNGDVCQIGTHTLHQRWTSSFQCLFESSLGPVEAMPVMIIMFKCKLKWLKDTFRRTVNPVRIDNWGLTSFIFTCSVYWICTDNELKTKCCSCETFQLCSSSSRHCG